MTVPRQVLPSDAQSEDSDRLLMIKFRFFLYMFIVGSVQGLFS
jgi:hypothetical protein